MTLGRYISVWTSAAAAALAFIIVADPPRQVAGWGASASAGSIVIGGRRLNCSRGKVIIDNRMRHIGLATRGTIRLNIRGLARFPSSFRQFVFLHECAHQYTFDEAEADCWAIKRGVYRGLFRQRAMRQICASLWNTSFSMWHNSGPERCKYMLRCFVNAGGKLTAPTRTRHVKRRLRSRTRMGLRGRRRKY